MYWYHWLALTALLLCLLNCLYHFYRIISLGKPPEYAMRAGNVNKAVRYSFTGAMSPKLKESAHMHIPTYLAGIIYHIGTFIAIFLFFLFLLNYRFEGKLQAIAIVILLISALCGLAILIKRIGHPGLRSLSNPDDYISNILVTAFHAITAITMYLPGLWIVYFIISSLLLFYIPLGKLKHAVYFFAARYHLGHFYGWRGVWPPKPVKK